VDEARRVPPVHATVSRVSEAYQLGHAQRHGRVALALRRDKSNLRARAPATASGSLSAVRGAKPSPAPTRLTVTHSLGSRCGIGAGWFLLYKPK